MNTAELQQLLDQYNQVCTAQAYDAPNAGEVQWQMHQNCLCGKVAKFNNFDLRACNLRDLRLIGASFSGVNFRGVDFGKADLRYADLSGADLRNADLRFAALTAAQLQDAMLDGAQLPASALPQTGEVRAWKRAAHGCQLQLMIPAHAERIAPLTSDLCRASEARITAIYNRDGQEAYGAYAEHDSKIVYSAGDVLRAGNKLCTDVRLPKGDGVSFYLTIQE